MKMAGVAAPENILIHLYPIALRMAKTPKSFGRSECNRVKVPSLMLQHIQLFLPL